MGDGHYKSNNGAAQESCPNSVGVELLSPDVEQTYISHCRCNTNLGLNLIHHSVNNSDHKYFCGMCGAGTFTTFYSLDHTPGVCACYTHANRVGGAEYDGQSRRVECQCPDDSDVDNGDCKCNDNMVMVQDSETDPWRCESCPDNSEVSDNTCICKQNYYNANTDVNEMPTCERCPSGTFKVAGNAGIAECQMDYRTKFCDRNGQNCMQLIPES